MPYPDIALIGEMGTGKTELADYLATHYGYTRHSWADPIYEVAQLAYGPISKDKTYEVTHNARHQRVTGRHILQTLGTNGVRTQLDEDFWVKAGARRLIEHRGRFGHAHFINDDTRFGNEATMLLNMGFVLVRVYLEHDIRVARLTLRDGRRPSDAELRHPSEIYVGNIACQISLWNTAPIDQTAAELMRQLANHEATA